MASKTVQESRVINHGELAPDDYLECACGRSFSVWDSRYLPLAQERKLACPCGKHHYLEAFDSDK